MASSIAMSVREPSFRGPGSRASEKRTIEISVGATIKALRFVDSGLYPSFDAVVEDALKRLSESMPHAELVEESLPSIHVIMEAVTPHPQAIAPTAGVSLPIVEPIPTTRTTPPILPFTVPRLLPAKVVARELVHALHRVREASGGGWIDYEAFRARLGPVAIEWHARLSRLDQEADRGRGERLATSLPSLRRDAKASLDRFLEAYAGWESLDGRVGGACQLLGLLALRTVGDETLIGLTEDGRRFALMENPVLDGDRNIFPPFSPEERDFLVALTSSRCPTEAVHMGTYLRAIFPRATDREQANRTMRRFYERFWSPSKLSDVLVDSTRAAVHSRLVELGFAETMRDGLRVTYLATDQGIRWAEAGLQSREA